MSVRFWPVGVTMSGVSLMNSKNSFDGRMPDCSPKYIQGQDRRRQMGGMRLEEKREYGFQYGMAPRCKRSVGFLLPCRR